MVKRLGEAGRGDRSSHEFKTDGRKRFGRQGWREPAGVKSVTISRETDEARNLVIANVIENLRAFKSVAAPIIAGNDPVACARPLGAFALRQIVRIRAHICRADRIAARGNPRSSLLSGNARCL